MTQQSNIRGKAIQAGYEWRLRVIVKGVGTFAPDATFVCQFRRTPDDEIVQAEISTADDTIRRINHETIELVLPGTDSADWTFDKAFLDVVRTDLGALQHLGFRLTVPVRRAITRGIA